MWTANPDLAERRRLMAIIEEQFGLDPKAAAELIATAEQSDREAVDLPPFFLCPERALDDDGRQKIVEMLWDIAYADGVADEFEENTIWRIAELLGVSTRDRVLLPSARRGASHAGWSARRPLGHGRREGQSMSEAVLTKAGSGPSVDAQPRSGTKMRRVTLITGASGGIGADLARVFTREGHDLVLIARHGAALEALADEIAVPGRPRPFMLAFDLLDRNAIPEIAAALKAARISPEILVNNAGFGLSARPPNWIRPELAVVDLNIRAAVDLTLRFLPAIRAARGKILNVASIASYFPGGPGMADIMRRKPSFSPSRRSHRSCARTVSQSPRCVLAIPKPHSRPAPVSDQTLISRACRGPPPWRSPKRVMPG